MIFCIATSRAKSGEPCRGLTSRLKGEKPQSSVAPSMSLGMCWAAIISSFRTCSAVSTSVETMIPFAAFAKLGQGHTPLGVNHQSQFPAATISFNLAQGKAISDAQKAIDDAIRDIGMPSSVRGAFAGTALLLNESRRHPGFCFSSDNVHASFSLGEEPVSEM